MNQAIIVIINYSQKNKVYNIEIDPQAKVSELIQELAALIHPMAQEKITLKYQGRVLDQNFSFQEYSVKKGAQIDLHVETLGGF